MAATKLTADGLLSTEEIDPNTEDTRMDTNMSYEEEDALLSEDQDEDVGASNDSVPNAQRPERKKETTNEPKKPEQTNKEPVHSHNTSNDRGRKRQREILPKSAKTTGSSDRKRPRHEEELNSIQEKIDSSNNSISLLNSHLAKGFMPQDLEIQCAG